MTSSLTCERTANCCTIPATIVENAKASKKAIVRMLDALKTKVSDEDVTVVYFVGHSRLDKRDAYLVFNDVDLTDLPNTRWVLS